MFYSSFLYSLFILIPYLLYLSYLFCANFLNKKYAKKWRTDMPKEKYKKIPQESFSTNEQMEVAAYYKWQSRGCPSNDSLTDWVEACEELAPESR